MSYILGSQEIQDDIAIFNDMVHSYIHSMEEVKQFQMGPPTSSQELPCLPKEFGHLLMNGLATENSIFSLSHQVNLSFPLLTHTQHEESAHLLP